MSRVNTDRNTDENEEEFDGDDDTAFDVVQSHKWYCYWVDPEHDPNQKEGWRILYEDLTSVLNTSNRTSGDTTAEESGSATPRLE
ncbi:hypothetical protein BGZ65_004123, partial [Modicella reniformis]